MRVIDLLDPWLPAGIIALLGGTMIFVGVTEYRDQQANRHACHGRYIQIGDRRDSGLCIRRDGVIWER